MTADTAPPAAPRPAKAVWEEYLGTGVAPNPLYYNHFNRTVREVLARAPHRILELGCSAGRLGEFIREKFPGTHHIGIEMNPEAAALARGRLTQVLEARLEDIDFAAAGIAPGSIDTFIAGDVLEHLYDPWRTLVRVRPLLTDDAQVAISLPNVRNLQIAAQLHNEGTWRYSPEGLLDVTHIRFFTVRDIFQMLDETGYRVANVRSNIDARYQHLYDANKGQPAVTLQIGRLKLENLNEAELLEYCTLQFVVLAHPKPAAANDPSAA